MERTKYARKTGAGSGADDQCGGRTACRRGSVQRGPAGRDAPTYLRTTRQSVSPSPSTPTVSESASPSESARNDLKKIPLKRSVKAGPLTARVEYTTALPIKDWRTGVPRPVQVNLTAVNRVNRSQNVYLLRATAEVTAHGDNGFVDRPPPIVDVANIIPGFIVKSPSDYNQIFNLPPVDSSATRLTIEFTYELVIQVSEGREPGRLLQAGRYRHSCGAARPIEVHARERHAVPARRKPSSTGS